MRITVFTPTYNRAYIIGKLYESLKRQTFRDFEWIVVDDGSADDTESLFQTYLQEENHFPIRYIKTENGGKHRAINTAVSLAQSELFFIVDSDDYLTDDALEAIDTYESTIPEFDKEKYAGVCGQRGFTTEIPIGTTFKGETLDITTLERPNYGISGDKAEVFYTKVLQKYPFPEFPGENFMTECIVWDRIAIDGYLLRFFNQITIVCNYLPDGLTAHSYTIFRKNPMGWAQYIAQSVEFGKLSGFSKWKAYLDYFYAMRNKIPFKKMAKALRINPIRLWLRLFGMRVFYKLYS